LQGNTTPDTLAWEAPADIVLVRAYAKLRGAFLVISLNPTIAQPDILGVADDTIFSDLIAVFFTNTEDEYFRQLSYPVGKGETVYFTTDTGCFVTVDYDLSAEVDHVVVS